MVPFGMQAVSKRSGPTNTAEHVATRAVAAAADGRGGGQLLLMMGEGGGQHSPKGTGGLQNKYQW